MIRRRTTTNFQSIALRRATAAGKKSELLFISDAQAGFQEPEGAHVVHGLDRGEIGFQVEAQELAVVKRCSGNSA